MKTGQIQKLRLEGKARPINNTPHIYDRYAV
jgi:hypothetical protein